MDKKKMLLEDLGYKALAEWFNYRDFILDNKSDEEIMNMAYEIATIAEVEKIIENASEYSFFVNRTEEELQALLETKNLLKACYYCYLGHKSETKELMYWCIEKTVERLLELKKYEKQEN